MNHYTRRLAPFIERWITTNRRVAIFGTGAHTDYLFEQVPELNSVNIVGYLESRPTTSVYRERPVYPLAWAHEHADVVLCSSFVSEPAMATLAEPLNCKVLLSHTEAPAVGPAGPSTQKGGGGQLNWGLESTSAWGQFTSSKVGELAMYRRADAVLVVTDAERQLLGTQIPIGKIHVVPDVHEVAEIIPPFEQRSGIVFVAGFRHGPNLDAASYLLDEIMPCVRRLLPDVHLTLLGSDPPREIVARSGPFTHVPGYLADIDTPLSLARLAMVPLRFGAGMKGKICRAMAVGTPNVCTTIGVESMNLLDGLHVRVGDSPEAFAEALADLYSDREQWERLSAAGLDIVCRDYSPTTAVAALHGALFPDSRWPETPLGLELNTHQCIATADRFAEVGAFDRAVETLTRGVEDCGKSSFLSFALGETLFRAGRFGDAVPPLMEAEHLGGERPATRRMLAQALYRTSRVAEAFECLSHLEHARAEVFSVVDMAWLARWSTELGTFEDAERRWNRVVLFAPGDLGARRWRAVVRKHLGHQTEALLDYSVAIALAIRTGDVGLAAALDREMSSLETGPIAAVQRGSLEDDERDYRAQQALCEALGVIAGSPGPVSRAEARALQPLVAQALGVRQ